jgi:zinc protease
LSTKNGTSAHQLDNGLTVLIKEMHHAPVTTFWVWYRVGSRNERSGITGVSHWVEHMMFKGTEQFPRGTLDNIVSREGGLWNAFTWLDFTTYFETLPANRFDLSLRIESDRMINSVFDPNEVNAERTVIISERQGHENSPMFRLGEEIQAAAFRVHSYHHEVIGDMADLQSMTRDDLYGHYRTFYAPNNAIAVAVGDFNRDEVLAKITDAFGGIPPGNGVPPVTRSEPAQTGERRVVAEGDETTAYLQVAYRAPAARAPNFFPMVILDSILAGASSFNIFGGGTTNRSSRLYKALVETELAAGISGSLSATIDPYLYVISATVREGHTPAEVEERLDAQLDRIVREPISQDELAKALKQAKAQFAFGSESVTNQGFWLGYSELLVDHTWFETYLDQLMQVTVEDVQRVAAEVLKRSNRVVGHYIPKRDA